MTMLRNSVYVLVAACSVAMAACQPSETPADRVANDIGQAARNLSQQIDRSTDKTESISVPAELAKK
jgi:hypothetical protein